MSTDNSSADLAKRAAESPIWQQQSVERSLTRARLRAEQRSVRFLEAAVALMAERASTDFTVQEVVERSGMSVRTFYNYFETKEDLLVAVQESILREEVVPRLKMHIHRESDPLDRLRTFVEALYESSASNIGASRALAAFYNRLAETRPEAVIHSYDPQLEIVIQLVEEAARAGALTTALEPLAAARFLHLTVISAVHARIFGSVPGEFTAEQLWLFCAAGLGVPEAALRPKRRGRTRSKR